MDYCQNIESIRESAKFSKILSMERRSPSFFTKSEGSRRESSGEPLELVVQRHFPASRKDCESEPGLGSIKFENRIGSAAHIVSPHINLYALTA